jgi:hypothetical protein
LELPDAVSHRFTGKSLRLYAIFSGTSLSVRQVEERLKSSTPARPGPLFPGTLERELPLEVE